MRNSYSMVHVPGKSLWTADTLSRSPVTSHMSTEEHGLMESTNIYIGYVIESLPVSVTYMENLKEQLKADSVCSRVMTMCTEGWPAHAKQEPVLKSYWPERATLTVKEGLLLKDTWLVIPAAMRNDVLAKLHEGHQGVEKCRSRARQSVWWPGLSQQVSEMVLKCRACIQERRKSLSCHQNAQKDHGKGHGCNCSYQVDFCQARCS